MVADGLDHPWDVAQAPDGTLLVDERAGGFTAVLPDGAVPAVERRLRRPLRPGETGLMGLVLDPGFAANRRFYSCQGVTDGAGAEIAGHRLDVAADWRAATRVADPLLGGIPVNQRSGRHGGCRLRFDPDGALLVGTGDNAVGSNPQDPGSLGGKVLRVDPATGEAGRQPVLDRPRRATGDLHLRAPQRAGLAVRPGPAVFYRSSRAPSRDDEVNLLAAGGNYGYDPDGAGGSYDESVPMTDPAIPGAVPAVWSSGAPTIATSGATFLDGRAVGRLRRAAAASAC